MQRLAVYRVSCDVKTFSAPRNSDPWFMRFTQPLWIPLLFCRAKLLLVNSQLLSIQPLEVFQPLFLIHGLITFKF
jgi:hypothetical protein